MSEIVGDLGADDKMGHRFMDGFDKGGKLMDFYADIAHRIKGV